MTDLTELNDTEGLALVALMRLMVRLDGHFTDAERSVLDDVAEEMGRERFWQLVELTGKDYSESEQVRSAAQAVERPEARALIFAVLQDLAMSDTIGGVEGDLLSWLAESWSLRPDEG